MLREFCAARLHFIRTRPARQNRRTSCGHPETDAVFRNWNPGEGESVVPKGVEEVEEENLRLAFLVALELGGKCGEVVKRLFL